MNIRRFVAAVCCFVLSGATIASASSEQTQTFTYQGQLLDNTGTNPATGIADFVFTIYNPTTDCLLYEESQTGIDLTASNGRFSVVIGSTTGNPKRTANDPTLAMSDIFRNDGATIRAASTPNCTPGYTPSAGDARTLRVTVTINAGTPVTLAPDEVIDAVPQAWVAETLQGISPASFVQLTGSDAVIPAGYGLKVNGTEVIDSSGQWVSPSGSLLSSSGGTLTGGLTISAGGETITSGGLDVNSTGITHAGDITGVGSNITGASAVTIAAGGAAQNLTLSSSTSGSVNVGSGNGTSLSVLDGGASTVNYVSVKGAAAGASPTIGTAGSDTDINLTITPKGTGNTIFSSGNVGIGTTLPSGPLHVVGGGPAYFDRFLSSSTQAPGLILRASRGSSGAQTTVQNGDYLGKILFDGYDGSTYLGTAQVNAVANGTITTNSIPTDLAFSTGSSSVNERMRITSSGNVGIGTTTPGSSLTVTKTNPIGTISTTGTAVTGTGTNFTSAFSVGDQIAASKQARTISAIASDTSLTLSSAFSSDVSAVNYSRVGTLLNAGNVGIGTTSPGTALHLSGASPTILEESFDSNSSAIGMRRANGTQSSPSVVLAGDALGQINFTGYGATNWVSGSAAKISAYSPENWSDTTGAAQLRFATRKSNDTSAADTAMTLDENGKLGIGTTSPMSVLDATASSGGVLTLSRKDTSIASNTTVGKIQFWNNDTQLTTQNIFAEIETQTASAVTTDAAAANLIFRTTGSTVGGSPLERMRIDTSGNVGIGTTSPSATLDVKGHVANSGATATIGSCGTSPLITGNDTRGVVTLGTGSPTACTVTFASAYSTAPYCVITPYGSLPGAIQWYITTTTTTIVINFSATPTASQQFQYLCMQ